MLALAFPIASLASTIFVLIQFEGFRPKTLTKYSPIDGRVHVEVVCHTSRVYGAVCSNMLAIGKPDSEFPGVCGCGEKDWEKDG